MKTGIGQAIRRFLPSETSKPCRIGGVTFEGVPGLQAESDGDVVYHAICNAISSMVNRQVLVEIAEEILKNRGITDSEVYLREAAGLLDGVSHVAISLEAKRPSFRDQFETMRANVARAMGIGMEQVGITALSGEGLSDVACGDGVRALAVVTA